MFYFNTFCNEAEACAFLGVSVAKLRFITKSHLLPCWVSVRDSRKKRWCKRDLKNYKNRYYASVQRIKK